MKYLTNVVETYRVDTETEANVLIDEAKKEGNLNKYSCTQREKKIKGEIVETWFRVVLNKTFTDEKEPETQVEINYTNMESAGF